MSEKENLFSKLKEIKEKKKKKKIEMKQSTVRRERKEIFIFSARARFKLDALTRRGCDTYLSPLL